MKHVILLLTLFLMACPHPSAPSNGTDGSALEAGPSDCNVEAGMVVVDAAPVMASSEVHFSPKGGCQDALVAHIQGAKKTIRVQAYSFTAKPVIDALIAAQAAGKDVQIILDASDAKLPVNPIPTLRAAKVPVFLDARQCHLGPGVGGLYIAGAVARRLQRRYMGDIRRSRFAARRRTGPRYFAPGFLGVGINIGQSHLPSPE